MPDTTPQQAELGESSDQPPEAEAADASGDSEDSAYPAGVWMRRLARVRRLLPRPLYRLIYGRLWARFSSEYAWRKSDDRENDREIPPDGERVEWHAVWLAEAFTPSTAANLASGIERLGWWDPHRDRRVADEVARLRRGRGGGTFYLPPLRRGKGGAGFGALPRELPPGVEYVTGRVSSFTPSLTMLVVGFRFDDSVSAALDAALRTRYRTYSTMLGTTGHRVMHPTFQRRDAVQELERRYVDGCREWLGKRLRGYFATGDDQSKAPGALLLTTREAKPFERDADARDWRDEAGVGYAVDRWDIGIPDVTLAYRFEHMPAIGGRWRDIFAHEEDWKRYGPEPSAWGLAYRVEQQLSDWFALQAAEAALSDVQRQLGRLRDSIAQLAASQTERHLATVQRQLGTLGSDVSAITSDVLNSSDWRSWLERDLPEFREIDESRSRRRDESKALRTLLVDGHVDHAREVRGFEASTRELLVAVGTIAGALENLRLQGTVKWVAILALIVALAALGVSAAGVGHDLGWWQPTLP